MAQVWNLLFLYTDEQAFWTLAVYGNLMIEMPNLNRLAEKSIIFEQTYVTQPICTPSRSSLLTGLYPHTNGCIHNNISLPNHIPCLPEMIRRHSYVTGHYGKWHLGDEIFPQHGFQHWRSIEDGYRKYYRPQYSQDARSHYHHFLLKHGFVPQDGSTFSRNETARFPEPYSKPSFLAHEACRFIQTHHQCPFILYVNFLEPHMPFFGPRDHQYNPEKIPLPSNFFYPPNEQNPLKLRILRETFYEWGYHFPLRTPQQWQRLIANYWGLCSLVDTYIGHILDTLKQYELMEKTIIVFTSDHGDMMGGHQLLGKAVMYEEAIRVPFLLYLPWEKRERRILSPVSQIDIVPTLLDLLGEEIPPYLEGRSLVPYLDNSRDSILLNNEVIIEWNGSQVNLLKDGDGKYRLPESIQRCFSMEEIQASLRDCVRTIITADGWKYNHSLEGEHELYNLKEDPLETKNLAFIPDYQSIVSDLRGRIGQWQRRTNDHIPLVCK